VDEALTVIAPVIVEAPVEVFISRPEGLRDVRVARGCGD